MKKETKVVALALVLLLIFLSGFGLGATKGINFNFNGKVEVVGAGSSAGGDSAAAPAAPAAPATTAAPAAPATTVAPPATTAAPAAPADTTAPAAPADTTAAPAGDATTAAPADTTAAPAGDAGANAGAVPSTKAEIAAAYNKVVNEAKAYTGKVTLKKHDIINVQLPESAVSKVLNPIVANLTQTSPEEYVFDGGKDVNDPNRLISHKIVPNGRDVAVEEAGLASATATANADGGYTMVLTFIAETATFDGTTTTSQPTHHKTAMDPLDLGSLDLGPVSITNADMKYPGATMTATVDGNGRLVKLEQKLPLEGSGTGKAGISVTLEITGSMDGTYEFIYA